jgi:hypothetical protein
MVANPDIGPFWGNFRFAGHTTATAVFSSSLAAMATDAIELATSQAGDGESAGTAFRRHAKPP